MVRAYDRLRHISTGRFGAAFLIKSGEKLAMMKTIDIGRLDSDARNEVLEEVGVLASLRHPHLAAVQECFIEGGYLCLVLQYADGGHAAGQIEKARRCCSDLDEPQILRWFTQAVLGLKHMHDRSVIHRDLRTRRLLLTAEGHVVLSSAAITALLRPTLSQERPDLEAMRYLSPELVEGGEHTAASDMWALGAILYELASLAPPFDHLHPRGLAERILSGPARPLPPRRSKEMQNLCSSLMQRQAVDRLTSTDTLRQPLIQDRLRKLFDEEPPFVPGAAVTMPRVEAAAATPRRGGFGPLLLHEPVTTPRGLRHVGEQVTGIKCGTVGVTGTTTLRYPSRASSLLSEGLFSDGLGSRTDSKETPGGMNSLCGGRKASMQSTSSRYSMQSYSNSGWLGRKTSVQSYSGWRDNRKSSKMSKRSSLLLSEEDIQSAEQHVKNEMAGDHAKIYAGIMVETALEELNFTSSRLLEEDVPFARFSLPTSVDTTTGATWQIDKEVTHVGSSDQADIAPAGHSREFPRFA